MANKPFFPSSKVDLFGEEEEPTAPKRTTGQGCESCQRYKGCQTPKFPVHGQGARGILLIAESPGPNDDAQGHPLSGDAGALIRRELRKHGIDVERDCWTTHAIRCHLPSDWKDQTDKAAEGERARAAKECRPKLHADIVSLRPRIIVPMGVAAITALLSDRLTGRLNNVKPSAFLGLQIPDQDLRAWVCPVESPRYLLKNKCPTDLMDQLAEAVAALAALVPVPVPPKPPENRRTLHNPREAAEFLDTLRKKSSDIGFEVGFDYETTGIKPHAEGHRIVCASVGWEDQCAVMPMFPDHTFRESWKALMLDPMVSKGAHNAQFEAMWTYHYLGYWPVGWSFDTCLDAHVLHNTRPTSLKFETYTRLGILGYDSAIDKYLHSKEKGCNVFNNVEQAPLDQLMHYCALDSRYMMEVRRLQSLSMREWPRQIKGSRFFLNASMALARDSSWGMRVDTDRLEETYRDLSLSIAEAEAKVQACPEIKAMGPGFNVGSNPDLLRLVSKLGYKTKSVDKEFLETVAEPFADSLLESRQLRKMRDTYLEQYRREAVGGIIRGAFNLAGGNRSDEDGGGADSYRASHADPNLANIPKRNKTMQKAIRSIYRPSPGNRIKEYDYGQIEVRVGACYHKDPNMLRYVEDPTTNMHTDTAMDLFFRKDPGEVRKPERQAAKNGFVFPSFYGSGCVSTYLGVWKQIEPETKEHLASKGITALQPKEWTSWNKDRRRDYIKAVKRNPDHTWLSHVAGVEKLLWEERFPGYARWKRDIYDDYLRRGYIELYTGFRCRGPLIFTKATNLQIQGSAFHCLLWTILQIDEKIRNLSGKSHIVCNIHDALVVDLHPDDEAEVDRLVWEYGTQRVRNHWPWIITPLVIEAERSEIDGSWAAMENCGELHFSP